MAAAGPLIIASTAMSAASSLSAGRDQANAYKMQGQYQQQIHETNARMMEVQARDAERRGGQEVTALRRKARQVHGSQRASLAGQGVDVGAGIALDLSDETKAMAELDEITLKNNAWREAWGFRTQSIQERYSGQFARLSGNTKSSNAKRASYFDAANSILSGGYRFSQA